MKDPLKDFLNKYREAYKEYKDYKSDYTMDQGKSFLTQKKFSFSCSELKKETNLHMVRIRFGTFSFEKITRGIKANWIDKLSYFGGNFGLFNGFSIICMFEILILCIDIFLKCIALLYKYCNCCVNKENGSKDEENKSNQNIKTNDEIDKKIEAVLKNVGAVQRELVMNRQEMDDENQKLEEKFNDVEMELTKYELRTGAKQQKLKNVERELKTKIDIYIVNTKIEERLAMYLD